MTWVTSFAWNASLIFSTTLTTCSSVAGVLAERWNPQQTSPDNLSWSSQLPYSAMVHGWPADNVGGIWNLPPFEDPTVKINITIYMWRWSGPKWPLCGRFFSIMFKILSDSETFLVLRCFTVSWISLIETILVRSFNGSSFLDQWISVCWTSLYQFL